MKKIIYKFCQKYKNIKILKGFVMNIIEYRDNILPKNHVSKWWGKVFCYFRSYLGKLLYIITLNTALKW